ncbi:MAG TPA: ScyD/ScyE family protein [Sphingomicrobium sp.]|nr:ScyD/ScyE family protein [Sphingomicrobium sp.]
MSNRTNALLRTAAVAAFILPLAFTATSAGAATATLVADGFNNPRELKFGPDGVLYVAEGGVSTGDLSTIGTCPQVPAVGPYKASASGGRISKIVNGQRVTVNDRFPSSETSDASGNLTSSVADIAWIGKTMYAITAGLGCSHGLQNTVNGVYRINGNSPPTLVADLSAFQMANPTAQEFLGDFEPDGTWYSMIAIRGALYAVEPNHGELDRISTSGAISRVADISASLGHIVPTVVASHGNFYVANLGTFPIQGNSKVLKVTPSGYVTPVAWGLSTVLGIAFDNRDRMYVLENTVGAPGPAPGDGDIIRIDPNGKKTIIISGLNLPGGMTMGPDGALYITTWSFGGGPGMGQVFKVTGL